MPRTKKSTTTSSKTSKRSNRGRKSNAEKAAIRNNTTSSVESMKYEIAKEFGVKLGASSTAKENGRVGGEMTKRLVEKAKNSRKSK